MYIGQKYVYSFCQVKMSVENYDLEELSIRTEDGQILVVGKQRKENHAKDAALRSFTRKIAIPEGMEGAGLKWEVNLDNILTITVPRKAS